MGRRKRNTTRKRRISKKKRKTNERMRLRVIRRSNGRGNWKEDDG